MSNKKNTDKTNNIEPKFDEYQAYEELRIIFVIAIETQDFSTLETRISAWEKKYPLAEFTDQEIIRKIKAILNKDFLSRLIGDYLAAKVLHEQEKQQKAYDELKTIIDNAKKTKDYKTALKQVRKWKDNLHANGFSLYSFNRLYRARICTLLLLPSKELKNQEQATDELKKIKENGYSMNSKDYFEAISNWQNTYSISNFPDKLKKELNQITTEVFDSISQKRSSENAITEIKNLLLEKDKVLHSDSIASILAKYDYKHFDQEAISQIEKLSMEALYLQESTLKNGMPNINLNMLSTISPTEVQALTSLQDILNKTPHDMDTILNWIYVNRKINYSEFARENIIKQFLSVGYKIPEQSSYSIPEINPNLDYQDFSKIDDIRKNVILNYLGIISHGNKLSTSGKDNLVEAHTISTQEAKVQDETKPIMFLEAFDTVINRPEPEVEKLYDEKGELKTDSQEELIYNIFIEDIIDNPLATYSLQTTSTDKSIEISEKQDISIISPEAQIVIEHSLEDDITPISDISEETKIIDEISETETTSSSEDTNPEYSLTIEDNKNLEQAQSLSTYVVIATPILEQALELSTERVRKVKKQKDKIRDL